MKIYKLQTYPAAISYTTVWKTYCPNLNYILCFQWKVLRTFKTLPSSNTSLSQDIYFQTLTLFQRLSSSTLSINYLILVLLDMWLQNEVKYKSHFNWQYSLPSILCYLIKNYNLRTREVLVLPWSCWGQDQKLRMLYGTSARKTGNNTFWDIMVGSPF